MRAVLDTNVFISALIAPNGAPAKIFLAWLDGEFELIVSPRLLAELERALGYRKLRGRVTNSETRVLLDLLRAAADLRDDPTEAPPAHSGDPDDDYVLTLAFASQALIVSGDHHLLDLRDDLRELPVFAPVAFLALLDERRS